MRFSSRKTNILGVEIDNLSLPELMTRIDSFIKDGITIRGYDELHIGKNCAINKGCFFSALGGIKIGDFVAIAHDCSFHTNSHNYENKEIPIAQQGRTLKKIIIEDDVWIGCHTVVLQGVKIGKGSIIGANSLVNKNIPPYTIAGGIPIKFIGKR